MSFPHDNAGRVRIARLRRHNAAVLTSRSGGYDGQPAPSFRLIDERPGDHVRAVAFASDGYTLRRRRACASLRSNAFQDLSAIAQCINLVTVGSCGQSNVLKCGRRRDGNDAAFLRRRSTDGPRPQLQLAADCAAQHEGVLVDAHVGVA